MTTIKEVAARSGVTVTTVSRVLNNRGYISDSTRRKVYDAMKELQYEPNEIARSLSMQKSNRIGVLVPDLNDPMSMQFVAEMNKKARENGYQLLIDCEGYEEEQQMNALARLKANRVAAILRYKDHIELKGTTIGCDYIQAGSMAAEHLIACECKRLLYLSIKQSQEEEKQEYGFIQYCKERKIESKSQSTDGTARSIRKILEENRDIEGIFVNSDELAIKVMQTAGILGIRVPNDLQIIGFGDLPMAGFLSMIHIPMQEMAEEAMRIIVEEKEGQAVPTKISLPVTLKKRESTKYKGKEEAIYKTEYK